MNDKTNRVLALLTKKQKQQDIIELNAVPENDSIIEYLNEIGGLGINYSKPAKPNPGYIQEIGGSTCFWSKCLDGVWIIRLWRIRWFMEAQRPQRSE